MLCRLRNGFLWYFVIHVVLILTDPKEIQRMTILPFINIVIRKVSDSEAGANDAEYSYLALFEPDKMSPRSARVEE